MTRRNIHPVYFTVVLKLLCVVLLVNCAASTSEQGTGNADPAPITPPPGTLFDTTLMRADGQSVETSAWRGRAVLIVAASMDDLRSQVLLRDLERVGREHSDALVTVALFGDRHAFSDLREMVPVYAALLHLSHTVLAIADEAIRSGQSPFGDITSVPTTFFLNRTGRLIRRVEGRLNYTQLQELVQPAIPAGL